MGVGTVTKVETTGAVLEVEELERFGSLARIGTMTCLTLDPSDPAELRL